MSDSDNTMTHDEAGAAAATLQSNLHKLFTRAKDGLTSLRKEIYLGQAGITATIRPLSIDEFDEANQRAMKRTIVNGSPVQEMSAERYSAIICSYGTVDPDFNSTEVRTAFGGSPIDAVMKLLLPGERQRLSEEILRLSGFEDSIREEVKKS